MKITFIMASGFSLAGGDRVIAIYAERLQHRGHEVFVISRPRRKPSLREQLRSLVRGQGWIPITNNGPSHFDDVDVPRQVLGRWRPVTDADILDADVVVATWWETAEWVANLSKAKGAKVYFVQHHEVVLDYFSQDRAEATYSLPLHKITIAKWLVELMQTRYKDTDVSFVPNSVDTQQFYAPPRSKQPIPTIGMVYSTTPSKGCDISLKAFSLAAQEIPNLRLVVLGNEKLSPNLPLPSGSEYVCRPPQNMLRNLYANCDAWLLGSHLEGFGLPILEAMACRTPVIGTPTGAAPELLADGAGVLVRPDDPKDMAKAIKQIYELTDAEWQVMSNTAYDKVHSYTWDDATDRFEAALYKAIERSQRGDFLVDALKNGRS